MISKIKNHETFPGAKAPLFDRLMNPTGPMASLDNDIKSMEILDLNGLKKSIVREITLLLETRPTAKRLAEKDNLNGASDYILPTFYGLPDFSWFDTSDKASLHQITLRLKDLIQHYEPRLFNPRVIYQGLDRSNLGVHLTIEGDVQWENMRYPLHFPISLRNLFLK